ncbi:MAG: DUF4180 domain-containing protein [candidate division FCPU426 bacterium]
MTSEKKPYLRCTTQDTVMRTPQDALDLLGQVYEYDISRFLFHETNFAPEFYDLKTKLAGEILQKFSNYSIQAAILGDFKAVASSRFREFMYECNQGRQLRFATSEADAVAWLGS